MITLTAAGHDTISLPGDMRLSNELDWVGVGQQVNIALDGSPLIQVSQQTGGRHLILTGDEDVFITRGTVKALRTLASDPGLAITLSLEGGREFDVVFDQDGPIEATPVIFMEPPDDADPYFLTLRFVTLS